MSSWFKRAKQGVQTPTKEKKETPEGLWYKCRSCKSVMTSEDHSCECVGLRFMCSYHERIGSIEYFRILFDENKFTEVNRNLSSGDPLGFEDTKKVHR